MPLFRRTPAPPVEERANVAVVASPSGVFGGTAEYRQPVDRAGTIAAGHDREPLVASVARVAAAHLADPTIRLTGARTGTGTPVEDHPILRAFNTVASASVSATELRMWVSYGLDYAGECYLYITANAVTPIVGGRMVVLTAGDVVDELGAPATVAGYRLEDDGGRLIARFDENGLERGGPGRVVRIFEPHPLNPWRADSLVQRAGLPIDVLHRARVYTRTVLENAGAVGGVLAIDDEGVDQESLDAVERRLNAALRARRGEWLVVNAATTATQLSPQVVGGQWDAVADRATDDILAVWRMPPSMLGRGGARTFENQRVELAQWTRGFLLPRLDLIAAALNKAARREGFEVAWDTSGLEVLAGDYDKGAQRGAALFQAGVITTNEFRALAGLPPLAGPEGDELRGAAAAERLELVEAVQKVYLGVGTVLTAEEARAILNGYGADLAPGVVPTPATPAPTREDDAAPFDRAAPELAERARRLPALWETAYERAVRDGEDRLAEWFQDYINRIERNAQGALRRRLGLDRAEGDEVPAVAADELLDVGKRDAELAADLPAVLEAEVEQVLDALGDAVRQAGGDTEAWESSLNAARRRLTAALTERVGTLTGLEGINANLADDVGRALRAGYEAGDGVPQLAARVRDAFAATGADEPPAWRARTIARTEANSVANNSAYTQMVESGVVRRVKWYSVADVRTRDSHAEANGEERDIGVDFSIGGYPAARPHDPRLPASECVNCRCRLIPIV